MTDFKAFYKGKKLREKLNSKYEPKLIEVGAIKKAPGIYELNEWLCYPTKGFAMNKYNPRKRMRINRVLSKTQEPQNEY